MADVKKTVSTLVFDPHRVVVLLVKKRRPSWLEGKWTAVGGHQEPDELPAQAATRELEEETGYLVEDVTPFASVKRGENVCTMFAATLMWPGPPQQKTDEEVKIWELSQVLNGNPDDFSDDLRWLIEMALAALRGREKNEKGIMTFLDITVGRMVRY